MHSFIRALVLTVGLLSTASAAADPPTAQEATMIATVIAEHERSVALLERLVAVNSGSMNLQGVQEVGRILRAEFELLGFQVRWVPMAETRRAGHLIATLACEGTGIRGAPRRVRAPSPAAIRGGLAHICPSLRA